MFPEQPAAASGAWTGDDTFTAKICFYETPFCVTMSLKFSGGQQLLFDTTSNVAFGPTKQPQLVGKLEPTRDGLKMATPVFSKSAPRRPFRAVVAAVVGISLATIAGCKNDTARPTPKPLDPAKPLVFREQDLPFQYDRGETGSAWPVETTGGGVGLLDFDGDGRLDIFLAKVAR